jgi:hypothetical protein
MAEHEDDPDDSRIWATAGSKLGAETLASADGMQPSRARGNDDVATRFATGTKACVASGQAVGSRLVDGMIHNDELERIAGACSAFLGLDYRREFIAHSRPRRPAWTEPLAIDGRIRTRCAELQESLDAITGAHASRLASL